MTNSKIVIGVNEKDKKEAEPLFKNTLVDTRTAAPNTEQESEQEPVDENVWGNDHSILNRLDEKQLADRRLYTRVAYIQKVKCNAILESVEAQPVLLAKPIDFMVIDISMGGIGIICESEIALGTILAFNLTLENITYEIKCGVIYCYENDDKFRAGLKIAVMDKNFIRHLKIFVAKLSLQNRYGATQMNYINKVI